MKEYEYRVEQIWMKDSIDARSFGQSVEDELNTLSEIGWRVISIFWLFRRDIVTGDRLMVILERKV